MEKDKIFFGEAGLTSTSANYIANMAKELYQTAEALLDNVVFYDTDVKLLGTNDVTVVRKGTPTTEGFLDTLQGIAQCKSLIAWLREAISAKDRLILETQKKSYADYGLEVPLSPERSSYLTEDQYIATWNIKRRNRYYYLEAVCATIGEYIHPKGVMSVQRAKLAEVISSPNEVVGNGRDTLIYSRTPSVAQQQVEDTFMELQNTYREYQAELNSMKHEITEAVNKDKIAKDLDYSNQMKDYRTKMQFLDSQLTAFKNQDVAEVSKYKIIIPDALKEIYDKVQSLGKKM